MVFVVLVQVRFRVWSVVVVLRHVSRARLVAGEVLLLLLRVLLRVMRKMVAAAAVARP
jgi:hypothetical protein